MSDTLTEWLPRLLAIPAASRNDELYEWTSPIDRPRFAALYARLERVIAWKSPRKGKLAVRDRGRRSALVGRLYERLLGVLFNGRGALTVAQNVRTTTSEVDLLLKIEPIGSASLPCLQNIGTHVIGEAKCHAEPPSSELVNECAGFLSTVSARLCLLFVFCSSRVVGRDARTAIAIHAAQNVFIVPLGRKQLEAVRSGVPIMRVISEQRVDAATHSTQLEI